MIPASLLKRFLTRTLASLAAIAAVSAIFGLKAYEIEQRRDVAPAVAMAPAGGPVHTAH